MNYDNKYPTFSFRVDHNMKSKLDKLAIIKKISTNEFARQVITKYLNNDLVEKSDNLQTEKIKLQIEKLKAEIKYAQIKNTYFENFNQPMTRRAEIAIKPQIIEQKQVFQNPQSPYDASNKRLQCIDCGSLFCWYSEKEFNSQMAEFQRHLVSKHNRVKTEIERQVLIDLKYEGDSK
jgi:hypothetical protein